MEKKKLTEKDCLQYENLIPQFSRQFARIFQENLKTMQNKEKEKQYLESMKSLYCDSCRCEIQKHYKDCAFRAFDKERCGDLATILEAYLRHCEINETIKDGKKR